VSAEIVMEHSTEIFERFADALPFGVLIVKSDWITVSWNRRAEQITGYQRQQVLGRKCQELLLLGCERVQGMCGSEGCPLKPNGRTGTLTEIAFTHKEGHTVALMVEAIPLAEGDEKGLPVAMIFQEKAASREMRQWTSQGPAQSHDEYGLATMEETREEMLVTLPQGGTGILLMEVENSEQMARHFGRELVHTVVRRLIRSVSHLVAFPHFLGHWSDERFLLLVPNCKGESLQQLVRALEAASAGYGIRWWGDRVAPRIHVSGVTTGDSETVEEALKRLEARYEAARRERE
jgi:PAS domain S-box-containing protein